MAMYIRGGALKPFADAYELRDQLLKEDSRQPQPMWGLRLPYSASTKGFMAVGTPEAGKSLEIDMLMGSVFPYVNGQSDHRALVYDHKGEMVSLLAGLQAVDSTGAPLGFGIPYKILNPFDERSAAWDIAADIDRPKLAESLAHILIPERQNNANDFFDTAARAILKGVVISLMSLMGKSWTLRDIVNALLGDQEDLVRILKAHRRNSYLVNRYFREKRLGEHILAGIASRIEPYIEVAAAWSLSLEKVSIRHWLNGSYVLVLGSDNSSRKTMEAVNKIIFRRVVDLIKRQADTPADTRRTWIVLDELKELGKLDGLNELLSFGRSKGACVVIGFQDWPGLVEVYGEKLAQTIVGLCTNRAFLRTMCPETAKWMSSFFCSVEFEEDQISNQHSDSAGRSVQSALQLTFQVGSSQMTMEQVMNQISYQEGWNSNVGGGPGGGNWNNGQNGGKSDAQATTKGNQAGTNESEARGLNLTEGENTQSQDTHGVTKIRKIGVLVLDAEFMMIPYTNKKNGLTGFYQNMLGWYRDTMDPKAISSRLPRRERSVPDFLERDGDDEYVEEWSNAERARLGLLTDTPTREERRRQDTGEVYTFAEWDLDQETTDVTR